MGGEDKKVERPRYRTVDELMEGGSKSTVFDDVQRKIAEESAMELCDPAVARQMEAWSMIGSKVVGREGKL